ncbi:MAG: PEP/pyruvate-binding domain-containing protein [Bacteroidota bacterium]|jgi:predicted nucleotidyltransferase
MSNADKPVESLLVALKERAKELNCLYEVEELFSKADATLESILEGIVRALPAGWQYPDVCHARITYGDSVFQTPNLRETQWVQSADLVVQDEVVGKISVFYGEERPISDEGPFLKEERRLINTIADRLERRLFHERLKTVFEDQRSKSESGSQWLVILDLLKRTDAKLLARITRKMLNHLAWSGVKEANVLLERLSPASQNEQDGQQDENRPLQATLPSDVLAMTESIFAVAGRFLGEREIVNTIQKWIMEERSSFLVKVLEDSGSSLAEIVNAIERFHHLAPHGMELPPARAKAFRVSLIQRLLNDEPNFINVSKRYVEVDDFYQLLHRIIFPAGSHGKLGGKGSGLFLASNVLRKVAGEETSLRNLKTPKTWYLTSDGILNFINHNDLEEIVEQKYEDISQVRQEYPYVIHVFKSSPLPPEIVNALSVALDDLGECPLIVRSSSLLEDRPGTSFAGKYKSLFIANQGTKRERLVALMDAIAEVYASTFNPDAIGYRIERGLLDFHEEMGVLIQEVVGKKIGDYFLPAFAGVGFAHNEIRWSHRIRKEDGLLRMVPGLGTRAVDRVSDDYPILVSPGQPNLPVNVTVDEKIRYSPKKIDVINLRTNRFETITIGELLRNHGNDYPMIYQLVSRIRDDRIEQPGRMDIDFEKDDLIVSFDGLVNNTGFIQQIRGVIRTLQRELGTPVDIEFAHDGTDLYLLQCRTQSRAATSPPAPIPRDVPRDQIIFSASRYVSNGTVSNITYIVYVDPQKYDQLTNRSDLLSVGRAVSKLNRVLPKRQFILLGPGRWGSRGDIKLGVSVTYSDINNSAMLIEIARKQKDYVPELSFGTHFFQDLIESSIRYLPLYPDDAGVVFNEEFLTTSKDVLSDLVPEYAYLAGTIRVIDVAETTGGKVLQVLMDGEREEALALLSEPSASVPVELMRPDGVDVTEGREDAHWRWRLTSVERMALQLDPKRFGVKAVYLFGSTKNATAGPQSDIDILVHFEGSESQRRELMPWLEGWSLCLAEVNYLRTGYKTEHLLDVHVVTDEDIKNRTSFAVKIGALTDPPRPLQLGSRSSQ